MFGISIATIMTVLTIAAALGGLTLAWRGWGILQRVRRERYFQLRRKEILRGWTRITQGMGLVVVAFLIWGMGKTTVEVVIPPTPIPTLAPTLTLTPSLTPPPTLSLTPSQTLPPSMTSPPTATITPTATLEPTATTPPVFPTQLITPAPQPILALPPADAVLGRVRMSATNNCGNLDLDSAVLPPDTKSIYGLFPYNNWAPGMEWTTVWLRNGQIIYVLTEIWDASTGGCGYTDFDNHGLDWSEGDYEVQIFVGDRYLGSGRFKVQK